MVAKTYGVRLSTIVRDLFPHLDWLTPYDWYALDVVGVQVYNQLLQRAHEEGAGATTGGPSGDQPPSNPGAWRRWQAGKNGRPAVSVPPVRPGEAYTEGETLILKGSEIPPWER